MPAQANILLVEDDADLRVTLKELLDLRSHTVETASDGQEALEKLNGGFPADVIVLDLTMAGMDGWQLSAKLRDDGEFGRIPIVVISAMDGKDLPEQAVARLRKPVELSSLYRTIEDCCSDSS